MSESQNALRQRAERRLQSIADLIDEAMTMMQGAAHSSGCAIYDDEPCDCPARSLAKARLLASRKL